MEIENTTSSQPGLIMGGVVGGLLMAVVGALSYMGSRLGEFPSLTDDFFAWMRDLLPGGILTKGIDVQVDLLISLNVGDDLDNIAKTVEQISSYAMFVGVGIVAGIIVFQALRTRNTSNANANLVTGLVIGVALGVVMTFVSDSKQFFTALSVSDIVWIIALFTAFGAAASWVYNRLSAISAEAASAEMLDRRRFLVQIGGAAAVMTVVGAGLGRLLQDNDEVTSFATSIDTDPVAEATPEAAAEPVQVASGEFVPANGTRPEYTPLDDHYRIDISTNPPDIREAEWALKINGLVAEETQVTLAELRNNYEPIDQLITLACISNRIGGNLTSTTRWTGVPLHILLDEWNVSPEAKYVRITCADGFDEYMELDLARQDERIMLAYAWDGKPLKEKHGFPLRIYIPDHFGMKQPKWIIGMEMVAEWDEGYWVRRGWSATALMRTVSVIDTVAVNDIYEQDGQLFVPLGGIAHAGARGISKVEVQVDEGEWVEAQLKDPLSETTWVLWRYDWSFAEGEHRFSVRTYQGDGTMQITENNGVRPDGATGIHSVKGEVEAPAANA